MKVTKIAVAVLTVAGLALSPAGAAEEVEKSDNVKSIARDKYVGGTELASDGKYLFTGSLDGETNRGEDKTQGGMRIYNTKGKFKRLSFLNCPGNDNDVEVVKRGLAIMGFAANQCAPAAGNGFVTIDYKNPKKPKIIGMVNTGKNHTFKPVTGTDYVYTAGGGLSGGTGAGPAIVDVSNPSKPEVVGKGDTYTMDCHDISFWVSKDNEQRLGFCAGAIGTGEVQIWNVDDPLEPTLISKIVNPVIQYSHYAVASSDGQYLAIDDEAFALHECVTGQTPTGRVWFYDISNPLTPIPIGSFAAPRGGDDVPIGHLVGWVDSWCLSHGLDWQPGTHNLAVTWFTGGWSVLNVDGNVPEELAYFQAEDSATYSVLWHQGNLYANDMHRGVEGFKVKGLK